MPIRTRRVVEQAFGGLMRSRRLARDDERLPEASAAVVRASAIHRVARPAHPGRERG